MNTEINNTLGTRKAATKAKLAKRTEMLSGLRKHLALGLTLSSKDQDSWALFCEDASTPGEVRYQTFDARGFSGHHTFHELDEALVDAFNSGYRYVDNGALDRVALTAEWCEGMAIQAIRDQYNSGKIDWDEMFKQIKDVSATVH